MAEDQTPTPPEDSREDEAAATPEPQAGGGSPIVGIDIKDELAKSYMNYAMSVIIARALPDVRDGLKPVQRRVLYAMRMLNLRPDQPFAKCAKVTGQTSGDYHPHGDGIIYPTLVRMAQPFTMRYPLIQGQGNFGSVDGDPPAAQRYTECRLAPISMEMLEDLDRETVDFMDNYSQTLQEPQVLPGKFPNLLCNGSQGIAVGMATSMPPHNLTEVCGALLHRLAHPESTLPEIMEHLPGPDFPTYGLIMGTEGIRRAYESGRGSVVMQAKTMIEPGASGRTTIVVTELPYQVNKENLVKSIAAIIRERKFDGLMSVNDYSDKRGMRMEIDVRRDVNPNKALNYLLKHTPLRTSFSCILLSLAPAARTDSGVQLAPRVSPLLLMLDSHLAHRREVIERRTRYELYQALTSVHRLEGFQIARRFLDEVIRAIRESRDEGSARVRLIRDFGMSAFQANAVLAMQLRRLTQLEQDALERDYKDVLRKAQNLMDILTRDERMRQELENELIYLRDKFGDERRSRIIAREVGDFSEEDLIPEEEAIISISRDGYIKRISMDAYRQQKRGGKGMKNVQKADDEPAHLFQVMTHNTILFFTDKGRAYKLRAYDVPESGRYSRGMPVINYIAITGDERVTATVSIQDLSGEGYLTMITRHGEIKRTALENFVNMRSNGLNAFDIEEGDELGWVMVTSGDDQLILVTRNGMSIRFHETQATQRSRNAGGVKAITLRPGDELVAAAVADDERQLLVVGDKGYGKRTPMDQYKVQSRGGLGVLTMNVTAKTGSIIGAEVVETKDRLLVLTSGGKGIRLRVKEIREVSRVAQGVKLIDLSKDDSIASIARLVLDPTEAEGGTAAESEEEE